MTKLLGSTLAGQRVLVTGAGGSIGIELCRQIAKAGARSLVLVGHGENSIFDIAEHVRRRSRRRLRCRR